MADTCETASGWSAPVSIATELLLSHGYGEGEILVGELDRRYRVLPVADDCVRHVDGQRRVAFLLNFLAVGSDHRQFQTGARALETQDELELSRLGTMIYLGN